MNKVGKAVWIFVPFLSGLFIATGLGDAKLAYSAEEYGPEHVDVRAMVDRAVAYLDSPKMHRLHTSADYDILIGYAIYKATEDHNHPKVVKAIPMAQKFIRGVVEGDKETGMKSLHLLYEVSISAMFLAALDGVKYKTELENCRDFFSKVQRPTGSFGYLNVMTNSGDTSQIQYVTLALWSIKQANVEVDMKVVERVCVFLKDAQSEDGGWAYQSPSGGPYTHTMLAAGLSAVLISGDILGVMRGPGAKIENALAGEEEEKDEGDIPEVFRRVSDEELAGKKEKKYVAKLVTRDMLRKVSGKAFSWLEANPYKRSGSSDWFYYWLYSQERYESFMEILNGKRVKNPAWYREGVETLKRYQDPKTGGFGIVEESADVGGTEVATCLSILYLLRTTQKAIGDLKEGSNVGGQGNLGNVADVTIVDGKVADKSQVSNIDDMLKMLETNKEGSPQDKLLADRIVLESDPKSRKEQLNRFARMLRSPSYSSRALAAKILGRGDDLDYVPDLIYALSDPDSRVPLIAENSLRILSRQMNSFVLPREGIITNDDRVKAERRWKQWYLTIRPDHLFPGG